MLRLPALFHQGKQAQRDEKTIGHKMAQSGHKQFPFAWRAKWLLLMQASPTAASVFTYMYWRSDKNNIFDLCEELVCKDLGLNRQTLCKARSLIAKHGGFKRICERTKTGQLAVKYEVLGFEMGDQVREPHTSDKSEKPTPKPSTSSPYVAKRDHTVNTFLESAVDTSNQPPVDTTPLGRKQASAIGPSKTGEAVTDRKWSINSLDDQHEMQKNLGDYPIGRGVDFIQKLGCNPDDHREWFAFIDLMSYFARHENPCMNQEHALWSYWHWNQQHKTGGLLFYSLQDARDAILSDNRKGAYPQWLKHEALAACPKRCYQTFPKLIGDTLFESEFKPVEEDIPNTDCTAHQQAHQHKRGTCPTGAACHPNAPKYRKENIGWDSPKPEPCWNCNNSDENKGKKCAFHKDFLPRIKTCPNCKHLPKNIIEMCQAHIFENKQYMDAKEFDL